MVVVDQQHQQQKLDDNHNNNNNTGIVPRPSFNNSSNFNNKSAQAAQVRVNVNGSDIATSGGNALNNNTWYHLVIQRTGTTVKIISNGVEIGTGTDSGNYTLDRPIRIGADLSGLNSITAHIDEFRYSTVARYATIPFTSPNGIFQGDTDTKVLCHFDGADGATGPQGIQGDQGIQGEKGDQGDQGPYRSRGSWAWGSIAANLPHQRLNLHLLGSLRLSFCSLNRPIQTILGLIGETVT